MNVLQGAAFHKAFVSALYGEGSLPLSTQPGFAVYRNTVLKGCIDALQANFPSVVRLVGEEWFRATAAVYVRAQPPTDRSLLRYGHDFADFLRGFAPADDLPYLPGVAMLDRAWLAAHTAADQPVLEVATLAALPAQDLARVRLVAHASARWFWFEEAPVYSIWDASRRELAVSDPLEWRPEGALLLRRDDEVIWCALARADFVFLEGCRTGQDLGVALEAASSCGADVAALLPRLLSMGVFHRAQLD